MVWGDGTNDAAIGPAADVTPVWKPRAGKHNVVAYADPAGLVRIVDADTGELLGAFGRGEVPVSLDWSRDGTQLLVLYRDSVRILDPEGRELRRTNLAPAEMAAYGSFLPSLDTIVLLAPNGGLEVAWCSRITSATISRSGRSSLGVAASPG